MSKQARLRDQICRLAKSMFDRGLTSGASGNISAKLDDGSLIVTPTGSSLGTLNPRQLSHFNCAGQQIDGAVPTKELPIHTAFYESRRQTGAVVHLHSTYAVALSMLADTDPDNVLPPLTAYGIMRLGKVKLLPVFMPGDPAMAAAVHGLAGQRSAVLLRNHGPVVAGKDLQAAVYAIEELEETAKLALLTYGLSPKLLSQSDVFKLVRAFNTEWDD